MCDDRSEDVSPLLTSIHCTSRLSYPTCEDLGIPFADFSQDTSDCPAGERDVIYSSSSQVKPVFKMHGMTYDARDPNNPFSPYCRIPLPSPFGAYEYGFEPAFIRKRNERERERVRCVNEGYMRLRQHIPNGGKDKRISKVETLRGAIKYIEDLQKMIRDTDGATGEDTFVHAHEDLDDDDATENIKIKRRRKDTNGDSRNKLSP